MDMQSAEKYDQTQKRKQRCWPCSKDRQRCTIKTNESDDSPCLRCRSMKHDCLDEGPEDFKPRPRNRMNCMECRQRHTKCIFPEGETKIPCKYCKSHNLVCSLPPEPSKKRTLEMIPSSPVKKKQLHKPGPSSPSVGGETQPTTATILATPAADTDGSISNSASGVAEVVTEPRLCFDATNMTLNGSPTAAGSANKTVVSPHTNQTSPLELLGPEDSNQLQKLNLPSQPDDCVYPTNDRITNAPITNDFVAKPGISEKVLQILSQNPHLSEEQWFQLLQYLENMVERQASSTMTETSEPGSPHSDSGESTCTSSGTCPRRFRKETTPTPLCAGNPTSPPVQHSAIIPDLIRGVTV
ncbi:hypothetical protein K440DRAFT_665085 [Wilcoxina mikolae CBS 423.85]|nr:hypothetical protein K440DRAFT_665085 [Wilcoxina mikolae CBS 423.85]